MKAFHHGGVWTPLLGTSFFLLGSCAKSDHKPVYPVRGQVFYKGKPATGALILLHEISDPASQEVRPHGQVDQNGDFVLSTYAAKDGAPAGDYVVTVDWRQTIPGRGGTGPSILPPEYGLSQRSPLRATVRAESNNLPPFHIDR
ncbi:MAG TPA: hypothetical protein VMF69_21685 [Gemmataceae bacterium]|nr:hypothetical protein [Gemmataceae bacterium]